MSDRDFEAGGKKFKLNKIDAFKQFHIVRRLGPILGDIIPMAQSLKSLKADNMSKEQTFDAIAKLAGPIMGGLSKLSDVDANLVLIGLCSGAEIYQAQSKSWARVVHGEVLMFDDLNLPTLLQIAGRSFAYNLSDFFSIAPQTSHGPT